jgi:hypothetical protein
MQAFIFIGLLSLFVPGQAAGTDWQALAPKDGGFSILFPGIPTESNKAIKTASGTTNVTLFELKVPPGDGRFVFGYSQLPDSSILVGTEDKHLDNARDGAVASSKGKLIREKSLLLDTHPGRELYIEVEGKAIVLMRMYAVKHRLYQVVVVGSADLVTSQSAAKFLDSFKLVK